MPTWQIYHLFFFMHASTQIKVDLSTATVADLQYWIVKFGKKYVGYTFKDAMDVPEFMDFVIRWMKPQNPEEEAFQRYVKLVLEEHKVPASAFI